MQFPEVTRIINVKGFSTFSTYEANEYFPKLTAQQMASILRRDERITHIKKQWINCSIGNRDMFFRISIWRVVV